MIDLSLHFTATTLTFPALIRSNRKTSHDLATSLQGQWTEIVSGLTNVTHQKRLYRNSWSHGEIVTAGFDLLFCWISPCALGPGCEQSGRGTLHTPQVRTFLLLHRGDARWILHAGLSPDFLWIPPKARPQGGIGTPTQELGVSEAWQKFSSFLKNLFLLDQSFCIWVPKIS